MDKYFQGASKRYAARIRAQKGSKSIPGQVEKILDYQSLIAVYDEFVILMDYFKGTPDRISSTGRLLKGTPGAWQGIWKRAGLSSLRKLLRMAKMPEPDDLVWGQQEFADYQMEHAVTQIAETTGKQIGERVEAGLLEGSSLDDIAKQIVDYAPTDKTFGYSRAKTIARTESTNAITGAHLRSFEAAKDDFGIKLKKAWVANRDDRTRDEHLDLELKYGRDNQAIDTTEPFKVSGYSGLGPGKFGAAEMDINCRCTVVPVVIT